jgi:hypothetical protein
VPDAALTDRERLGKHGYRPQRVRNPDEMIRFFVEDLGSEAVEPEHPTLLEIPGQAAVVGTELAGLAVATRPTDGRNHQIVLV